MARADSSVRVAITGDAKGFQRAAKDANKATSGIGTTAQKAGTLIAGAFAVKGILDFTQTALNEADRLGDATGRLEEQLGDLSKPLIDASGGFEDLGQSQQDILELEARFADMGTAAGIADEKLAPMAQTAAEAAAALALVDPNRDAATILEDIGKAAGGADKPLKNLGISITDAEVEARALHDTGKKSAEALTDNELAAARAQLIMEKLAPKVAAVTDSEADLERQQLTLQAKFETFTGKVGDAVDGPLTDLLTVMLDIGEQAGDSAADIKSASAVITSSLNSIKGPARTIIDLFRQIVDLAALVNPAAGLARQAGFGSGGGPTGPIGGGTHAPHPGIVVQVSGGSPEVIEQSVIRAVNNTLNKTPIR